MLASPGNGPSQLTIWLSGPGLGGVGNPQVRPSGVEKLTPGAPPRFSCVVKAAVMSAKPLRSGKPGGCAEAMGATAATNRMTAQATARIDLMMYIMLSYRITAAGPLQAAAARP